MISAGAKAPAVFFLRWAGSFFYQQEFFVKVADRVVLRAFPIDLPVVGPAVGERARNADSADGIQPVGILDDEPFEGKRQVGLRGGEGEIGADEQHQVDLPLLRSGLHEPLAHHLECFGFFLRRDQFVVGYVVQQGSGDHHLAVRFGVGPQDLFGVGYYACHVREVMPRGFAGVPGFGFGMKVLRVHTSGQK